MQGLGCLTQGWFLGSSSFEDEQGPPLLSSTLVAHAQALTAEWQFGFGFGGMCCQSGLEELWAVLVT